jgi:hypothetical protein
MSVSGQQLTNNTLTRKRGTNAVLTRNSQMSADSSATVDSALYSNLRYQFIFYSFFLMHPGIGVRVSLQRFLFLYHVVESLQPH